MEFLQLLNKWGTLLCCSDEPPAPANPLPAAPLLIQALTSLLHLPHCHQCTVAALCPALTDKLTAWSPETGNHLLMVCPGEEGDGICLLSREEVGFASFGPRAPEPRVPRMSCAAFPAPSMGWPRRAQPSGQLPCVNDAAKETRISHSDPFFSQKCQSSVCYLDWENGLRILPGLMELHIS